MATCYLLLYRCSNASLLSTLHTLLSRLLTSTVYGTLYSVMLSINRVDHDGPGRRFVTFKIAYRLSLLLRVGQTKCASDTGGPVPETRLVEARCLADLQES